MMGVRGKMSNKKVLELTKEIVGEDAVKIVDYLRDKPNISEFKIAEKTKTEIHQVRNILYRLHNHNLATYIKKKDRQKGWYISYWTFNKRRVRELTDSLKTQKLEKYKYRLSVEEANKNNFFMCSNACIRLDFQSATEHDFKCPECGNLLNQMDNVKTIEFLKVKIKELASA